MTDKEKLEKVKAEIERLKEIAEYNLSHSKMDRGAWMQQAAVCTKLLSFIDSMQKEPTISVWHDASEKAEKGKLYLYRTNQNIVDINRSEGKEFPDYCERWAYIDDIMNLSNVERTGKNWKEEPVSEDLEKEMNKMFPILGHTASTKLGFYDTARHFANWQKEQIMAKAVDAECFGFQSAALFSFKLPVKDYLVGSKVRVIVIKEDE